MSKKTDKNVSANHDSFFRASMQHIEVARAFFEVHVPKHIAKRIDFDSLKIEPNSYIDQDHKEVISDILYSVQIDQDLGYIYLLAEHQSTPQTLMPYRLIKYIFGIFDHHLKKQKGEKNRKRLPIIVPLILYNGKDSPYPYSTNLFDCFTDPGLAEKVMFNGPFKLIDLTTEPDEKLRRHKEAAVMELLEKHIRTRDILPLIELLAKSGLLEQLQQLGAGEYLQFTLNYVLNKGEASDNRKVIELLSETLPNEDIMTIAESLKKEGRKEGMRAGMEKMAKNLLASGKLDAQSIAEASGLPLSKVNALKP